MHLNGGIVKMSFEGKKKLAGNWQMNTILIILGGGGGGGGNGHRTSGAIYTIIFKYDYVVYGRS